MHQAVHTVSMLKPLPAKPSVVLPLEVDTPVTSSVAEEVVECMLRTLVATTPS